MEHPVILEELMRQRESQTVVDAERRRLLQASNLQAAAHHRRSVLSLVLEVELPWGRRVRVRFGRMARGFP